jgi:hypothetical protein
MSIADEHRHSWQLQISSLGKDRVFCVCGKQFFAQNQIVPYTGRVPEKFQ